jgi:hypothetical protein
LVSFSFLYGFFRCSRPSIRPRSIEHTATARDSIRVFSPPPSPLPRARSFNHRHHHDDDDDDELFAGAFGFGVSVRL